MYPFVSLFGLGREVGGCRSEFPLCGASNEQGVEVGPGDCQGFQAILCCHGDRKPYLGDDRLPVKKAVEGGLGVAKYIRCDDEQACSSAVDIGVRLIARMNLGPSKSFPSVKHSLSTAYGSLKSPVLVMVRRGERSHP